MSSMMATTIAAGRICCKSKRHLVYGGSRLS
jgi:hypothetical protein